MKSNGRVSGATSGALSPDVFSPRCPSRVLFDHVTSRWALLILVALSNQTLRWGELSRLLQPVTDKMLAQALRTLEADRLVRREVYPEVPPRVDYSLTERGQELVALLRPVVDWAQTHAEEIIADAD